MGGNMPLHIQVWGPQLNFLSSVKKWGGGIYHHSPACESEGGRSPPPASCAYGLGKSKKEEPLTVGKVMIPLHTLYISLVTPIGHHDC